MKKMSFLPVHGHVSLIATIVVGGLFQPSPAQAFEQRFYAGLSGGSSQLEPDTSDSVFELDDTDGRVGSAFLGWDFSPRWSIEGYYSGLGSASVSQPGIGGAGPADVDYITAGVSALAYFYSFQNASGLISRRGVSLFGGAGIGYLETSSDVQIRQLEQAHVLLTAGIEYGSGSGFAARFQVDGFDQDAVAARLGILYRFGRSSSPRIETVSAESEGEFVASTAADLADGTPINYTAPRDTSTGLPAAAIADSDSVYTSSAESSYGPNYQDQDNDGVVDANDVCAGTGYGSPVNASGCALFDGRVDGLVFASGSADIGSAGRELLDSVAAKLLLHPGVRIAVQAHTDNQGSAAGNLSLAKQRAVAVSSYLVARGVGKDRLEAQAYGESRPVASNADENGRRLNRRIEIRTL